MATLHYWDGTQWVSMSDLTVYISGKENPWAQILVPVVSGSEGIDAYIVNLDPLVLTDIDAPT